MREIKIKTLTQLLTEEPTKLKKQEIYALVTALLTGLAAHLYQYTNKIYNYDDLRANIGGYGTGVEYGRWFLQAMGEWSNKNLGNYSLPLFNGLFALILLALCAVMMVRLFDVKEVLLASFIGALFVTIPSVVCMNFFMFTALYYAIGIFLSFLSGYLMVKHGRNICLQMIAILLMACSVGVYQAYAANTICVLVLSVIVMSAFSGNEVTAKEIVLTSIRYVVSLILGILCYFGLLQVSLAYWNASLGGYQGIEKMGQIELTQLPQMLLNCYRNFIYFCKWDILWENPTSIVKTGILIMYAVAVVLVVYVLVKRRDDIGKLILAILSLAVYPVAVFFVYIMAADSYIYPLMTYSVVFIYLLVLVLLDRNLQREVGTDWKIKLLGQLMHWGVSVAALAITVIYIWNANGNYMSLWYTQQHDVAYFQTIVTQIRSAEGYRDGLPLAIIGREAEIVDTAHSAGSLVGAEFDLPGKSETNINGYARWMIFMQYLGYNPTFLFDAETSEIATWEEVQAMPCYPTEGSIQIVDDVIVLKLSDGVQ